jgi:hypothetical protein
VVVVERAVAVVAVLEDLGHLRELLAVALLPNQN